MEGLETLVTPSHHHTYLLTESAAAAHFNVLSFDTCSLFKTAATTASSYNLNNNNHSTANNNHHSQTQLLNNHHLQQMQQSTLQHQTAANTSNSSITSSHSATSVTQAKSDSTAVSSSTATTTTSTAGHHHPTLNIHETQQQSADRNVQQQTGDLNTPVTTSGDIPSFFGPSTVVEPPIITGTSSLLLLFCCFSYHSCMFVCGIEESYFISIKLDSRPTTHLTLAITAHSESEFNFRS